MEFRFDDALPVLRRTPTVLREGREPSAAAWTAYLSILRFR